MAIQRIDAATAAREVLRVADVRRSEAVRGHDQAVQQGVRQDERARDEMAAAAVVDVKTAQKVEAPAAYTSTGKSAAVTNQAAAAMTANPVSRVPQAIEAAPVDEAAMAEELAAAPSAPVQTVAALAGRSAPRPVGAVGVAPEAASVSATQEVETLDPDAVRQAKATASPAFAEELVQGTVAENPRLTAADREADVRARKRAALPVRGAKVAYARAGAVAARAADEGMESDEASARGRR